MNFLFFEMVFIRLSDIWNLPHDHMPSVTLSHGIPAFLGKFLKLHPNGTYKVGYKTTFRKEENILCKIKTNNTIYEFFQSSQHYWESYFGICWLSNVDLYVILIFFYRQYEHIHCTVLLFFSSVGAYDRTISYWMYIIWRTTYTNFSLFELL